MPETTSTESRVIEVLLVEDNPVDARLFREILSRDAGPFKLTVTASLAEAVSSISSRKFDVAVVDLNLHDSEGLNTLKAIRAVVDLPTVVITATADEAIAVEALRLGAQDYLMKSDMHARLVPRALRYAMERHRMQMQLEQSQRVARLGNLAGQLAHNFNNVLMGIQPHAELVKRAGKDNPKITASIEQIESSLKRGKNITSEILKFTRYTLPRIAPVPVHELLDALRREFPQLRAEPTSADLMVAGDREQLVRGLGNLVRNAFEANAGATVTISARLAGHVVEFHVVDNAGGIRADIRDRIFDPLYTTKQHAAGLGLPIVQQIVDAHGGTIALDSVPGEGTMAKVTLPSL